MGDFPDFSKEVRQAVDDELHRLVLVHGDGVYLVPASIMEIPAGKYCDQGQEPNCPLVRCLFWHDVDYPTTCVPDVYRGVDVVTMRCKQCLAAYPNGAAVVIVPKAKE